MLNRFIYSTTKRETDKEEKKVTGKTTWERFVNSQGGGGKLKPEDTPGTEAYVKKREKHHLVGVVESFNAYQMTVNIVVAGSDGKLGSSSCPLTDGDWRTGRG